MLYLTCLCIDVKNWIFSPLVFTKIYCVYVQHSIDYWLWADLIAPESQRLLKNVIRVHRQEEADFFYIPFFTTISYFLLEKQQCKALYRVCEWFQGLFLGNYVLCSCFDCESCKFREITSRA